VNVNKQTETRAEPCDLTLPASLEHTHTLESSLPRVCDPKAFCFFYSLAHRNSCLSREGVQVNNIEGSKTELSSYLTKRVSIIPCEVF